jgi:pilus assembly protein CpaF
MIITAIPMFGRRALNLASPVPPQPGEPTGTLRELMDAGSPITEEIVNELRNACLAWLDPNIVAAMPAERLILDVERLVSEIATERRFQLNAREQHIVANELVHDQRF